MKNRIVKIPHAIALPRELRSIVNAATTRRVHAVNQPRIGIIHDHAAATPQPSREFNVLAERTSAHGVAEAAICLHPATPHAEVSSADVQRIHNRRRVAHDLKINAIARRPRGERQRTLHTGVLAGIDNTPRHGGNALIFVGLQVALNEIARQQHVIVDEENDVTTRTKERRVARTGKRCNAVAVNVAVPALRELLQIPNCFRFMRWRLIVDDDFEVRMVEREHAVERFAQHRFPPVGGNNDAHKGRRAVHFPAASTTS